MLIYKSCRVCKRAKIILYVFKKAELHTRGYWEGFAFNSQVNWLIRLALLIESASFDNKSINTNYLLKFHISILNILFDQPFLCSKIISVHLWILQVIISQGLVLFQEVFLRRFYIIHYYLKVFEIFSIVGLHKLYLFYSISLRLPTRQNTKSHAQKALKV